MTNTAPDVADYDTDFHVWSGHQAALLRRLAAGEQVNDQVDWENVAAEIEALGRSDRRELRNRVETILFHLMKLQASAAITPRASWHDTLFEQRAGIEDILTDSPSLRRTVTAVIREKLARARLRAEASLSDHGEQPLVDLASIECIEDQVLGTWLP